MIWRGYLQYTYCTCQRCQRRVPIAYTVWQLGLLVCTAEAYNCADRTLLGAIELKQAREAARDRQELVPDPKLIHPVDPALQIETVPASAGVYGDH